MQNSVSKSPLESFGVASGFKSCSGVAKRISQGKDKGAERHVKDRVLYLFMCIISLTLIIILLNGYFIPFFIYRQEKRGSRYSRLSEDNTASERGQSHASLPLLNSVHNDLCTHPCWK